MSVQQRALYIEEPAGFIRLDRGGALVRSALEAAHVPLRRREAAQGGDPALIAASRGADTFLYTDDSGALERRDVETLEPVERWQVRCHSAPWVSMVSAEDVVVAADEDAGIYVFWPKRSQRVFIDTHAKHLQDIALSADGQLVAGALEGRGRALRVALWGLDPLRVHIFGLDRRAAPDVARGALYVGARLAWSEDGERLALLEWSASMAAGGVRAVVSVYDGPGARFECAAALDDEELGPGSGGGEGGALLWQGHTLWVGTCMGELVALDGRDGALRDVRWTGSAQPVTQLLAVRGAIWALTASGFLGEVSAGAP